MSNSKCARCGVTAKDCFNTLQFCTACKCKVCRTCSDFCEICDATLCKKTCGGDGVVWGDEPLVANNRKYYSSCSTCNWKPPTAAEEARNTDKAAFAAALFLSGYARDMSEAFSVPYPGKPCGGKKNGDKKNGGKK